MLASEYWVSYLIVFGTAFVLATVTMPLARRLAHRFGIVDAPRGRHMHRHVTPKLGGLALYVAFTGAVLVAQILPVPRFDPWETVRLAGLLIGGAFIFVCGLLDDVLEFGPLPQYFAQLSAAAIAVLFRVFIETLNNPFTGQQTDPWPFIVTVALSVFWLGLMMNTVNWLDGLDGLAGGVAFVASLVLFANAAFRLNPPQISVSLLPLALMGATAGFLFFNFPPARVFMGTNGSFFLGYTLGSLSIIGGAKTATILLTMGLPLLDVIWQIVNRLSQGRNPAQGDRGHLHFRLMDLGISPRLIVSGYYLFCAFFGMMALVTTSQVFKLLALVIMFALIILAFIVLTKVRRTESAA